MKKFKVIKCNNIEEAEALFKLKNISLTETNAISPEIFPICINLEESNEWMCGNYCFYENRPEKYKIISFNEFINPMPKIKTRCIWF